MTTLTVDELLHENEHLRRRLEEAEDALRALRAGEVDAILIEAEREQIYTLEAADKPYRLLIEQMPHAAATLTAEGEIIHCNSRFADLLQWPPRALIGKSLANFVATDDLPRLGALLSQGQGEISLRRADSTQVSVFLGVNSLQEGAFGTCLIVSDLTEQRHYEELERTQQALRASEERLASDLATARRLEEISTRLIQEGDVGPLYDDIVETAMAILRSDFATMQMFDPASRSLRLLAHRGFSDAFAESFRNMNTDASTTCGMAWRSGQRVVAPDLESFAGIAGTPSCEAHLKVGVRAAQSTPLISRSGDLLGMISTHWRTPLEPAERDLRRLDVLARQAADIIERKHSEDALRASESRLRLILDNTPAMVYVVDHQQRFTFINRRWETVFNLTNDQVAGRSIHDFFPRDIADAFTANNSEVLKARSPQEFEEVAQQADGKHTYISCKVPLFDPADNPSAICGISIDITERKRAAEALQEADRRKDDFLATLAHELRNPLAPIRSAVQILTAKGPPIPELQWARDVIARQVELMGRLLEDLLDVSRISRNKLELRTERVSLTAVLEAALETSRPLIEAGCHKLTVHLPVEPVWLEADPVRLAQIFANLLNNAAKYTEDGGGIWLTAELRGDEVTVAVKDSGIGIAAEMLPRVFEIFSQAEPALVRSQGGLGIGLSLVKGLVELHNGRIEVNSQGLGRGSEFLVHLPLGRKPPVQESAPPGENHEQPIVIKRRVLVVDDNRDSADSLAKLLRIMGHEVGTAYDGAQAVEVARTMQPDVALLDIGLPKLNGYEAAKAIRQQPWGKNMILIAVTGWGQCEDKRRSKEAGFDQHMVKPVDVQSLMILLSEAAAASG